MYRYHLRKFVFRPKLLIFGTACLILPSTLISLVHLNRDLIDFGIIRVLDMATREKWPEPEIDLKVRMRNF